MLVYHDNAVAEERKKSHFTVGDQSDSGKYFKSSTKQDYAGIDVRVFVCNVELPSSRLSRVSADVPGLSIRVS